jgi:ATP-dependent Zn protease
VNKSYKHVKKILENNVDNIRNVAKLLIKKETITSEEFYNVMEII